MGIAPIDLQTMYTQLSNVSKTMAGAQQAQLTEAMQQQGNIQRSMENAAKVQQTSNEKSDTNSVNQNGSNGSGEAQVVVANNVAQYVTVVIDGGHVSIVQDSELPFEITYNLSGSCNDGEFAMAGSFKATVALRGLTLTNPNGAAINITNGKRIALSVKDGQFNVNVKVSGNAVAPYQVSVAMKRAPEPPAAATQEPADDGGNADAVPAAD